MTTPLFVPSTLHDGPNTGQILIPFVDALPSSPTSNRAIILSADVGPSLAGLYIRGDVSWQFAMPIEAVSALIINGDASELYINVLTTQTLPATNVVYRNGQLQTGTVIEPGVNLVYSVRIPGAVTSGVDSVNGMTGIVILDASNLPGLSLIGQTGLYSDLIGAPGPYTLPIASAGVLGGIRIGPGLSIDVNGVVTAEGIAAITLTGDVTGNGTDTIPTLLSPTGVVAGAYTKVTVDAKGRVTLGENPTTLAGMGITDALPLAGGAMIGSITMTMGSTVTGLPAPVNGTDATNRDYVDTLVGGVANGVFWKNAVLAASTADIPTLSGLLIIDGYQTLAGDRILVKDQTDPIDNGVRIADAGTWLRAPDVDTGTEIRGMACLVINGTVNEFTQWVNTNLTEPVVGADPITYGQLRGEMTSYTAGAGLQLSGTEFALAPTGITPGQYQSVTVDGYGRVTAGGAISALDVNAALGYTAYDGAANPAGFLTSVTLDGDVIGTGGATITTELEPTGVEAGIWTKVTVDHKGRVFTGEDINQQDVEDALGYRPVSVEGDTMEGALSWAPPVVVNASVTTPLGTAPTNVILIGAGIGSLTAFDTAPQGTQKTLQFMADTTLVHSTSLILPGGSDIEAAVGDTAVFRNVSGTNWRCDFYQKADGTALVAGTGGVYTTTQNFLGSATQPGMNVVNAKEKMNLVFASPSATQNVYASLGNIHYYLGNATTNMTLNLSFSASTTLNTVMDVGESMTFAVMLTQSAAAFYPNQIRVDNGLLTPKWFGGNAPVGGNPNGVDCYTFTVVKISTGSFQVFATQTVYK